MNADSIIVINSKDSLIEDLDVIIKELSEATGNVLKPLISTVLPGYDTKEKSSHSLRQLNGTAASIESEKHGSVLSIVLYGFDKDNKIVNADTLKE